jgi:hypothetical protein
MRATGLCWLSYEEQMMLREMLKALQPRIINSELEVDNKLLRAEIETLKRMRHAKGKKL